MGSSPEPPGERGLRHLILAPETRCWVPTSRPTEPHVSVSRCLCPDHSPFSWCFQRTERGQLKNSCGTCSRWWLHSSPTSFSILVSGQHDHEACAPRGKLRHPSQAHRYEERETGPDRLVEGHLHGEMEGLGPGALGHSSGRLARPRPWWGALLPFLFQVPRWGQLLIKHKVGGQGLWAYPSRSRHPGASQSLFPHL